jgi:hypothetical protein
MSDLPATTKQKSVADLARDYRDAKAPVNAYLHDTSSEVGLIPKGSLLPTPDEVESSVGVELMVRVARALIRPMEIADPTVQPSGRRPATTLERLRSCGCPAEVYDQLARHPEFKTVYMAELESNIVLPRLPDMMRAATVKATEGSRDHLKEMRDILRLGDNPDEEGLRAQLRSMDDATFIRSMRELLDKGGALYGRLTESRVTVDRTQEVLAGEDIPDAPDPEPVIDHKALHGGDDG